MDKKVTATSVGYQWYQKEEEAFPVWPFILDDHIEKPIASEPHDNEKKNERPSERFNPQKWKVNIGQFDDAEPCAEQNR